MEEQYLIAGLRQGDSIAFSFLFKTFYKDLVLFGGTFLQDRVACEDIVQSVFMRLWNDRQTISIEKSVKSYLLKAVRNSCLDEIRHRHIIKEHESYVLSNNILDDMDTERYILYSNLQEHFQEALQALPEPYRVAFEMNRLENLKYKEIAEKLNVSERTVEVRIGKALELLRIELKEFFMLFILWFFLK